jgi:hypothetical protein
MTPVISSSTQGAIVDRPVALFLTIPLRPFEPVRPASHLEHLTVVQESIQYRLRYRLILEHLTPLLHTLVRRDHQG